MGGKFDARRPNPGAVIWHNPKCTTSRRTLELLRQRGVEPVIRVYLEDPPSRAELEDVLAKLGVEPSGLLRKKESLYKELELGAGDRSRADLIRAMAENPILIERPVVLCGDRAALGRPPENVTSLFES